MVSVWVKNSVLLLGIYGMTEYDELPVCAERSEHLLEEIFLRIWESREF